MLSVAVFACYAEYQYAECHYTKNRCTKCRYDECCNAECWYGECRSAIEVSPGPIVLKLFYGRNLQIFVISSNVCPLQTITA
jgi:hypothetical protein